MIELRNISVHAGTFQLESISLEIPTGRYAVLMGKTGSGKTTLLEAICGLRTVTTGEILLNARVMTHASPRRRGLGYVPQDLALFPTMTVRQHLEFALRLRRVSSRSRRQRICELAEMLLLEPLLARRVQQLSGGEAQRVALGRALSFHPSVLLLDEPLSALDEETRLSMQQLLRDVQRQTGVTVLHVTHQQAEAVALADRLFLLKAGRIVLASSESRLPPREQAERNE